jgi:hypothetical protein
MCVNARSKGPARVMKGELPGDPAETCVIGPALSGETVASALRAREYAVP